MYKRFRDKSLSAESTPRMLNNCWAKPTKEKRARHLRFKQMKTDVIGELWLSACGNSNAEPGDLSCEALKMCY